MYEAIVIGILIYQAIAFFLLGSWKESIRYEAGEITVPYILYSVLSAAFWPVVVLWCLFTRKK